jgi:hypothetical protein
MAIGWEILVLVLPLLLFWGLSKRRTRPGRFAPDDAFLDFESKDCSIDKLKGGQREKVLLAIVEGARKNSDWRSVYMGPMEVYGISPSEVEYRLRSEQ